MPQYVFNVRGQRHVFEAQNPVSAARFAQRWADQEAGRTPVTSTDIQRRLDLRPSQYGVDVGSRINQDVADLNSSINDVRAHPTDLLNAQKVLSAVSRYVPNALGLFPAASVDQLTGPVVRGINTRFGSHFDPRNTTDQILNAAGLLLGAGEPEGLAPGEGETSAQRLRLQGPGETAPPRLLSGPGEAPPRRLDTHIGTQPQLTARSREHLSVVPESEELGSHVLGQNSAQENVVPLSDGFTFNHQQRMKSLEDLPEDIQDKYSSAISDLVLDPILDDPDYGGHNSADVEHIRDELAKMAAEQRGSSGNARLADALDAANEDFRIMVNQQQPEMAKELALTRPEDNITSPSSSSPDQDIEHSLPGKLISFDQNVPPPQPVDDNTYDNIADVLNKWGKERVDAMFESWKDIGTTANDNDPLPNWAGKAAPKQDPILPRPEDFEPPTPLRDTLSEAEKVAWMKTAANDDAARDSPEYLRQYLPATWTPPRAQLPAVWTPPRTQLPVGFRPTNAFSLDWRTVPRAPNQASGFDFNALRPPQSPRWFPLGMTAAANQPQDSQQPQ
jgi:hypothetical protein